MFTAPLLLLHVTVLLHVGSSLGLFLKRRGGCDKSELLTIAWDEGRQDEGTMGEKSCT